MWTTLLFCTVMRIVLILTVFPLEYFHTVSWLYALFPITWIMASLSNGLAILILVPKSIRRIRDAASEEKKQAELAKESA
jgi:hypothetical protein